MDCFFVLSAVSSCGGPARRFFPRGFFQASAPESLCAARFHALITSNGIPPKAAAASVNEE